MTAPEPLTLERFIKDVANEYPRGGLVWRNDPRLYPRKVWVILDKFGDDGVRQTDYARRWEDLVEQFYSHPVPVVARDDDAELRAALKQLLANPYPLTFTGDPLSHREGRARHEAAMRAARAALAATEEES